MVAAVFEAEMSAEQASDLARLMDEGRPTRPADVLVTTSVPRGQELMRKVGVEPRVTFVDALEHA